MMEKYKICPVCRQKNPPSLMECAICEADLTGVKITGEGEGVEPVQQAPSATSSRAVRVCDCGAKNPSNARKCVVCGEDIFDVTPTFEEDLEAKDEYLPEENAGEKTADDEVVEGEEKESEVEEKPTATPTSICGEQKRRDIAAYMLKEIGGKAVYRVPEGQTTVGREKAMGDILFEKLYVSRVHARLILSEDGLFIENLSMTNFTFVNDEITDGRVKLFDGDEIGLGGKSINGKRQKNAAYFKVEKA